jgi:lipopolysaccharide biosynthesis regulator YciM
MNLMDKSLNNQILTPEEKRFAEYMKTGDDFTKIEIFRSAAAWYKKALDVRPDSEEAKQKLAGIKEKIKKENRAIYTIVAIFTVAVILVVVLV